VAGALPAARLASARAAASRLRARAAAALPGADATTAGLAAGLALAGLVAGWALLRNADLKRALRRRDRELNQLILMARPGRRPAFARRGCPRLLLCSGAFGGCAPPAGRGAAAVAAQACRKWTVWCGFRPHSLREPPVSQPHGSAMVGRFAGAADGPRIQPVVRAVQHGMSCSAWQRHRAPRADPDAPWSGAPLMGQSAPPQTLCLCLCGVRRAPRHCPAGKAVASVTGAGDARAQIINLQERMAGAAARARVPIVRHACSTSVASFCHPDIVSLASF